MALEQAENPEVSVVIPAKDEADRLPATLEAIETLDTTTPYEVLVVDGHSEDNTPEIAREHGARVLTQSGGGIGAARDQGARATDGDWLVFVDADTQLRPAFLEEMLPFLEEENLAAGTARCRVVGDPRGRLLAFLYNHLFPQKDRPVLPGFATVVRRDAYEAVGGFPDVASEDRAFSHALEAEYDVGFHPEVLVDTSARRVAEAGFLGTMVRYLRLDLATFRDSETDSTLPPVLVAAGVLTVLAGLLQVIHGLAFGHAGPGGRFSPVPAGLGFFGGIMLYVLGAYRRLLLAAGIAFVTLQIVSWAAVGPHHGIFGVVLASVLGALGGTLGVVLWHVE